MGDLGWMARLTPEQQDEVLKDLLAEERCDCDHRDDQHDENSHCIVCMLTPNPCIAYNPVQR